MGTWQAIIAIIKIMPKVLDLIVRLGTIFNDKRVQDAIDDASEIVQQMEQAQSVKEKFVAIRRLNDLFKRG